MRVRRPRQLVVDTLIALIVVSVAVRRGQDSDAVGWPDLDARAYGLLMLAHLPLVLRSRAPIAVFGAVLGASVVYISLGYWPVISTFGTMLALYTVTSLRSARQAVGCGAAMVAVWVYSGVIVNDVLDPVLAVAQAMLYCAVVLWFGTLARRTRESAQRLRVEQAERARREVAEERGRIARELHDVVAHHMAVVSVQAGLARFVFDSNAATALGALRTIEDASGEALEELRRMLQILRQQDQGDDDSAGPMPTLGDLADLVDRIRAGGVPVELSIEGTVRPLAPGVELCAYRVIQEALTNVLKHTGQANARVQVQYREHELLVTVMDDGKGTIGGSIAEGGHGLLGMRERARIYGGSISAGPRAEGGFAVCLKLPTSAAGSRRQTSAA
jgi:signal transduction histidine kinase